MTVRPRGVTTATERKCVVAEVHYFSSRPPLSDSAYGCQLAQSLLLSSRSGQGHRTVLEPPPRRSHVRPANRARHRPPGSCTHSDHNRYVLYVVPTKFRAMMETLEHINLTTINTRLHKCTKPRIHYALRACQFISGTFVLYILFSSLTFLSSFSPFCKKLTHFWRT